MDLSRVEIPAPSIGTQRNVVDILDRFDTLTKSLTDGIPAEIEARRQQYEYYRDRLLDIPRKAIGTEWPDGCAHERATDSLKIKGAHEDTYRLSSNYLIWSRQRKK